MLFSPLSEIPTIGRNIPYITSFALFVVFSATAATSQSFGALLAWRFLQGFMGSPALATAGATFQDIVLFPNTRSKFHLLILPVEHRIYAFRVHDLDCSGHYGTGFGSRSFGLCCTRHEVREQVLIGPQLTND